MREKRAASSMIQTFFDKNTRESDIDSITESDVCGSLGFEWMIRL